jgi:hypothetical protein
MPTNGDAPGPQGREWSPAVTSGELKCSSADLQLTQHGGYGWAIQIVVPKVGMAPFGRQQTGSNLLT